MAQDISEENSKEMAPTLKVGMKNIDTSLRSVDFAWNKFYMIVGQAIRPDSVGTDKFRQRRDAQDSVPTQSGRTGPTTVDRETK
jgi:hypothetical protein